MPVPDFAGVPVLVTGEAGFIGFHLVDALVQRGPPVRVLDSFAAGHRPNLAQIEGAMDLLAPDIHDLEA